MFNRLITHLRSSNWSRTISLLLIVALLGPAVSLLPVSAATPRVQPILLELATQQPETPVGVIVQKLVRDDSVENLVIRLGGTVTKNLPIINAFAAELPAGTVPALAQNPGVRWVSLDAPMVKAGVPEDETVTVRDEFNAVSFTNSDGLVKWTSEWLEIGESDGPEAGDVRVTSYLAGSDQGLRIQNAGKGAQRAVDLSGATFAMLSFDYRRKGFEKEQYVAVEVSADGGESWTGLDRLMGPATDPTLHSASYEMTGHATEKTVVRFIGSASLSSYSKLYIDNFQITYTRASDVDKGFTTPPIEPVLASTGGTQKVRDELNTTAYGNNDGSVNWSTAWIETGDNGSPSGGDITVEVDNCPISSSRCIEFDADSGVNDAIQRGADLSSATSATLTFDYRLDDTGAAYVLEVSTNGGGTWTTLKTYTSVANVLGETVNLTPYGAAGTRIRFRLTDTDEDAHLYIDNVQIEYAAGSSGAPTPPPIPVPPTPTPNPAPQASQTVRDEFNANSYSGNNGSQNWSSNWQELGESDGKDSGRIRVVSNPNCATVPCLRIGGTAGSNPGFGTTRTANLSGADTATLTFSYRRGNYSGGGSPSGATLTLSVSNNGGATWTNLKVFSFDGTDSAQVFESFDISSYISSNTHIRFLSAGALNDRVFFIDNIQIEYACAACIDTSNLASPYVRAIGADQLWNAPLYLQGQGITVAVVDSGVANHADLQQPASLLSRIRAAVQFNSTSNFLPDDFYGHGSHVAGTICGNGAQSGGAYMGVAPKASLVDVKVNDDQGAGTLSDVIAGLQWILDHKDEHNIRVVNLSMNSSVAESYHTSPLDAAVEILWFNGVVVVVSAGNNGAGANSGILFPPANDPFVITVGAADDMDTAVITDDVLAPFSAYGTTESGFVKPDLVVPGTDIINLLASDDTNLVLGHPAHAVPGLLGNYYFRMSGTSMASAVAAGAVALLLQDEPNLTPDQVKYRLMATERPFSGGNGAGYLDIYAAVHGTTTANANTGIEASALLWTGSNPIAWNSVNWNSVNWGSVNWNSVNWNSVNWNSVNWNSVHWDD
jgi:serine protease AprX